MTMHGADGSIASITPARGGHRPLGAEVLCVGVLAGAALLLLLAHRRGGTGALLPRRRRQSTQALALIRLSTSPPAVWAFSVIRC
jgi:hypothetical protein